MMANLSPFFTLLIAICCSLLGLPALAAADDGESVLHSEVSRAHNQSLFWGPYKPNLYFGVRPRVPQGLWTGLMWGKVNDFDTLRSCTTFLLSSLEIFYSVIYPMMLMFGRI